MTKIPKTKKIKKCRLCNNKKLINIHNFGNHDVSNFVTKPSVKKGGKFILPFPNFKVLNN